MIEKKFNMNNDNNDSTNNNNFSEWVYFLDKDTVTELYTENEYIKNEIEKEMLNYDKEAIGVVITKVLAHEIIKLETSFNTKYPKFVLKCFDGKIQVDKYLKTDNNDLTSDPFITPKEKEDLLIVLKSEDLNRIYCSNVYIKNCLDSILKKYKSEDNTNIKKQYNIGYDLSGVLSEYYLNLYSTIEEVFDVKIYYGLDTGNIFYIYNNNSNNNNIFESKNCNMDLNEVNKIIEEDKIKTKDSIKNNLSTDTNTFSIKEPSSTSKISYGSVDVVNDTPTIKIDNQHEVYFTDDPNKIHESKCIQDKSETKLIEDLLNVLENSSDLVLRLPCTDLVIEISKYKNVDIYQVSTRFNNKTNDKYAFGFNLINIERNNKENVLLIMKAYFEMKNNFEITLKTDFKTTLE